MAGPITETEAAVFNPTILHKAILKYRMPKTIAKNIFDLSYADVTVGANIDVDKTSRITVGTITLGTGFKTTSYQNPTEVKATISINKWSYGAFALEVYEEAVAAKDLESIYRQSAIDTVMVKIDSDVMADVTNFTTTAGTDNVSSTDDQINAIAKTFDVNLVPDGDRNLVFAPQQYYEYLKLDRWTSSLTTRAASPINSADLGKEMYGLRLWKTTQVKAGSAGHVNFAVHGDAEALVVRKQPSAWVLDDADVQARKIVYPAIYGFAKMRDDHGYQILGL